MAKIEFIISIFGTRYLLFLATCLQSIKNIYPDFLVSIYYDDIPFSTIMSFKRYLKNKNYRFKKSNIKILCPNNKSKLNTKIKYWKLGFENSKSDNICFLDVDTILIKTIDEVFNDDFDIGLTYNNHIENRIPINTGVIFSKKNDKIKIFFNEWENKITDFINNPKKYTDLYNKYGSGDQLTLMLILNELITEDISNYKINNTDFLTVKWLKCTEFNNLSSSLITDDIRIIHLKSKWHRILLDGVPIESVETRKNSQEILDIFLKHKKEVNELLKEICI